MRRPEPLVLVGRHVRLEPLGPQHRDELLTAAAQDPSTFRYMSFDLSRPEAWEGFLREALEGAARGDYVPWASVDLESGRAIGSTRYGDVAPEHGRLEIGWTWIAPSHQRSAINTEAKLLQLRHAFEDLGATRVALKTDARNLRSQAAIARLGAVREGTLRRHIRLPDGFLRDTVYYSILSDEWPQVRSGLEERLARGGRELPDGWRRAAQPAVPADQGS